MSSVLNWFSSEEKVLEKPEIVKPKDTVVSGDSLVKELSRFKISSMNPIDKLEDGTPIKKVVEKEKPFEVELSFQRKRILKIEEIEETMEQKVSKLEKEVSNLREDVKNLKNYLASLVL
jgi:predicted RNase H-like nuclease (RuvC/YqgF family)